MKVYRKIEMETGKIQIGDRIDAPLAGEEHTATAIQEEEDGVLFLLDEYLDNSYPMNREGGAEGGYDKSDLRKHLQKIAEELPDNFKRMLVPFENGDILAILSLGEMFGKACFMDGGGRLAYLKDARHRIATRKGTIVPGWLRDAVPSEHFALVDSCGREYSTAASGEFGVRPIFKIAQAGPEPDREPEFDSVNNPAHYTVGRKIEPIDVIEDWNLNFHRGNVVKYISRAGRKNKTASDDGAIEDLQKAVWYLEREINRLQDGMKEGGRRPADDEEE